MAEQTPATPESAGAPPAAAERRASERFVAEPASWRVIPEDGDDEPRAGVRDLSASGIGLLVDRRVLPGTVLVLRLQTRHRLTRPLPVRVMHASPGAEGEWLVGCQFVRRLSETELQSLLDDA